MGDDPRGVTAGTVLHRRLADQVARLRLRTQQAAAGDPEGVHQARVACRRLRSALATCRPLLDREVTDPLRDELRWLGRALGPARDTRVARERVFALVEERPEEDLPGPVRRRLERGYDDRAAAARAAVDATLGTPRFRNLLADLDRLVAEPPWTDRADLPAAEVLPGRVRREWKRVRRSMAAAEDAGQGRDEALHQARKDAKRLRYAAETLKPVWGKDAARLARAAKRLTSHLGERQDAVLTRGDLRRMAAEAEQAGESTLGWGVLLAHEERNAADLDRDLPRIWKAASRKRLRRWLG